MKKKILISILSLLVFTVFLACFDYNSKTDIHESTYQQIIEIHDVGTILNKRIQEYLIDNPTCDIDDLIDIKGIGPKTLKNIKEKFRYEKLWIKNFQ